MMDRNQLLAVKPDRVRTISVEGIGQLSLRILSGREALALEVVVRGDRTSENGLVKMCALQLAAFICDDAGKAILTEDDAMQLMDNLSASQVQQIIRAGADMNALGDDQVESAGKN